MDIGGISINRELSGGGVMKAPAANKEIGVNPSPDDIFKPHEEKSTIERMVDSVTGFVREYIVGPGGKYAEKLKSDFQTQAVTAGVAVGGATGAFIGYESARLEIQHTQSSTQTWQEPVMRSKYLGNIPSDYHSWWRFDSRTYNYDGQGKLIGGDPVHRPAPIVNTDGTVVMHDVTKTIDSQRFGMFGGIVGGAFLGAIGGAMAGIAAGIIHKVIRGK